jgi:hypothetical protein
LRHPRAVKLHAIGSPGTFQGKRELSLGRNSLFTKGETSGGSSVSLGRSSTRWGWPTVVVQFRWLARRKLGSFRAAIRTFAKKNISATVERCVYSFDPHGPMLIAVGTTNKVRKRSPKIDGMFRVIFLVPHDKGSSYNAWCGFHQDAPAAMCLLSNIDHFGK